MAKRYKVQVSSVTPQIHFVSGGHEIFSGEDAIILNMSLSEEEYKNLNGYLKQAQTKYHPDQRVCMALYHFTHDKASKHHRYSIWNTFRGISKLNYKVISL